jgi:hypothetical protein
MSISGVSHSSRRNVSKRRPSNLKMKHLLVLLVIAPLCAQTAEPLEARAVSVANAVYQGKSAVRLDAPPNAANGASYAIVKGSRFQNGTIEVELAGKPAANVGPAHADSSAWRSGYKGTATSTSTSGLRMGGQTTRCGGTIRLSTAHIRSSISTGCGRNRRRSTNRM